MLEHQLERIANALEKLAEGGGCGCAPKMEAPVETGVNSGSSSGTPVAADDREALLKRCEELGIDVPPRTRTNTLVVLIEEKEKTLAPLATANGADPDLPTPAAEPDPFDDPAPAEPPPRTVPTKDEVMQKLHEVMAKPEMGKAKVLEILQNFGKVIKFADLAEENFEAVMNAAEELVG